MNNLTIPPSPGWFHSSVLSCTNDNTLLYTARQNIIIIHPESLDKPAKIDMLHLPSGNIKYVVPNPNWNNPDKLAVAIASDKIVYLWDIKTLKIVTYHNKHTTNLTNLTGVIFAGNERIISVSENGFIVIWKYNTQEISVIKDLLGNKVHVNCISSCLHAPWLTAFGLKNGLIILADIRKSGKILYKLRGHDNAIISFSWCPVPVNIFKQDKSNTKQSLKIAQSEDKIEDEESEVSSEHVIESNENIAENKSSSSETSSKGSMVENIAECELLSTLIHETNKMESTEPVSSSDTNGELKSRTDDVENYVQPEDDTSNFEYLLASSALGDSICIWRAGTDGQIEKTLDTCKRNQKQMKSWITLCWIKSSILISSSAFSEMYQWNLLDEGTNLKPTIIHNYHSRNLFSIAAPINVCETIDAESNDNCNVWTYGNEGYLLSTSIFNDKKTLMSYPTVGGIVWAFASSPFDPTRLAITLGEGNIKFWDLGKENLQYIIMTRVSSKMSSKIMCLDFHPANESVLAFATVEGRVGTVNVINPSKLPMLLPQIFRTTISKIQWGPSPMDKKNFNLYVCAEGKVVAYDLTRPLDNPTTVEHNEHISDFSWKQDLSKLIVGTKMGTITLFSSDLKLISNLYLQKKPILKLLWHPNADENSGIEMDANYSDWVALYTNEACVYVYEISEHTDSDTTVKVNLINKFMSSANMLKCICWSPHENGVIAYSGDNGIVEIWRVKDNVHISTYNRPNFIPISKMIWSPIHKDYMITGNRDQTITIWHIEENQPKDKTALSNERKKLIKSINEKKIITNGIAETEKDDGDQGINEIKKWGTLLKCSQQMQNRTNSVDAIKTLLNHDIKDVSPADSEIEKNKSLAFLKIYGEKSDVMELINLEQLKHAEKKNFIANQHLSLWKGDLNEHIREAIDKEKVTPWLINMAPMVSQKLWFEACKSYAKTLSVKENSDPYETASYFLACHNIDEAIGVLCDSHLYNDALVVAKCRLSSTDPIINDILQKWIKRCVYTGNYEVAAQCYVSLKQYEEAAKLLFKRSNLASAELALELVKNCDNEELYKAIKNQYEELQKVVQENDDKELPTRAEIYLTKTEHVGDGDNLKNEDVKSVSEEFT